MTMVPPPAMTATPTTRTLSTKRRFEETLWQQDEEQEQEQEQERLEENSVPESHGGDIVSPKNKKPCSSCTRDLRPSLKRPRSGGHQDDHSRRRVCFATPQEPVWFYQPRTEPQEQQEDDECTSSCSNNRSSNKTKKEDLVRYAYTLQAAYRACWTTTKATHQQLQRGDHDDPQARQEEAEGGTTKQQQQHHRLLSYVPLLGRGGDDTGVSVRGMEGCLVPSLARTRRIRTQWVVRRVVQAAQKQQNCSDTRLVLVAALAHRWSAPAVAFARTLGMADAVAALREYRGSP